VLFHRVIRDFMIQTGNMMTKPGGKPDSIRSEETLPAEFVAENFHKKGALAAARIGDAANPEKRSSLTQFYIVHGRQYAADELLTLEIYYYKSFSAEQKVAYQTLGGAPFLDGDYTVFGEVVEGLDVVDAIAAQPTGQNDVPAEEIRLLRIVRE
jgi:peptidyl-prolyl cis-trans isomerase B (cyclophilin B)